jgi:hypothetical protein
MSKGLSKIQVSILGLLDGSIKKQSFSGSGSLTTSELLEELIACEIKTSDSPRKIAMFSVRRACLSLVERGLIEGVYTIDCDYPWAKTIAWSIVSSAKSK